METMELRELAQEVAAILNDVGEHVRAQQLIPHDFGNAKVPHGRAKFVTDIDDKVVQVCHERIQAVEPCDGFWEDEGTSGRPGRYWSFGHVDGAINYVRNMSEWTVTASLFEIDGEGKASPVVGVVAAPALGLMYLAARGAGAIHIRRTPQGAERREKIMPSITPTLAESVVSYGMSYFPEESRQALKVASSIAGQPADIKRVGPASLDLCKVADGTYDAYFEPRLHSWDIPAVSAGAVIVWEAQGTLSRWDGTPIRWDEGNDVIASNGIMVKELRGYLAASH